MDLDLVFCVDEPSILTESKTSLKKITYEWCERSNRLSIILIRSYVSKSIRDYILECNKVKELIKTIKV